MKYFTGHSIYHDVSAADASTFGQLVNRYISVAVPLPITRAAYQALDPKAKDKAKRSAYLTPGSFFNSPSERLLDKVRECNLIFLDVDPDKTTGKSVAHPWVRDPELLSEQLAPWMFAAYHTASSTKECPRIRIMVAAKGLARTSYASAVATIAKRIGLAKVTTESCVATQAMYLPAIFAGDTTEDHPLFAQRLEGKEFTEADIDNTASVTKDRGGKVQSATVEDYLIFLRQPVKGVTLKQVTESLDYVDADIDYREWLDIAAALKHQFHGTDEEEAAYELFDLWSSKGSKYAGEEETRAKWDSFAWTPEGRAPKTIRTVLSRAALGGWNAKPVIEQQFSDVLGWIRDTDLTLSELLNESLKRILSAALISTAQQEVLLAQVCNTAKKKHGVTVNITSLRKDMQAMYAAANKSSEERVLPAWAKGLCYVASTNQFFRHATGERYSPEAFDNTFAQHLTEADSSRPEVAPSDYVLNTLKIERAFDYSYRPDEPNRIFATREGKVTVNTYRATHPQPDIMGEDEAGELFEGHVRNIIAESEYAEILLDYCAFIVQNPGIKIRWCPLIQGAEGCGKTVFINAMTAVLGNEHVKLVDGSALFQTWTEWAANHMVVGIEEIRVVGQSRHEVMNKLKPLITNSVVPVSQRFQDSRDVPNVTNYFLLTNHHDAIAISPNDRRYFVVKSRFQSKDQVKAEMGGEYFNKLFDVFNNNAGGLRCWLENRTISSAFNPNGHAPVTIYHQQVVNDAATDLTAAIRSHLRCSDNELVQPDVLSAKALSMLLSHVEGLRSLTPQHLASALRDEGFVSVGDQQIRMGGDRHSVWYHHTFKGDPVSTIKDRFEEPWKIFM